MCSMSMATVHCISLGHRLVLDIRHNSCASKRTTDGLILALRTRLFRCGTGRTAHVLMAHAWKCTQCSMASAGSADTSQSAKVMTTARVSFLFQMRQQQREAAPKPCLTRLLFRLTLSCLMTHWGSMMMLTRTCMSRGGISMPEVTACSLALSVMLAVRHVLFIEKGMNKEGCILSGF